MAQTLNLSLSTDEVNLILEGLGNLPFVRVYTLIGKVQNQVNEQLNPSDLSNDPMDTAASLG